MQDFFILTKYCESGSPFRFACTNVVFQHARISPVVFPADFFDDQGRLVHSSTFISSSIGQIQELTVAVPAKIPSKCSSSIQSQQTKVFFFFLVRVFLPAHYYRRSNSKVMFEFSCPRLMLGLTIYGNTGCAVFKRGYKIRKIFA